MDDAKFAQWRDHLMRTYGKHTFVTKAWIDAQLSPAAANRAKPDLCAVCQPLVFSEGSPTARLMFIDEGRPFAGPAGQLLDKIIEAMGLARADVCVTNVVKCREKTCEQFLFRQIEAIRPQVIVALGGTALKALLQDDGVEISQRRGKFTEFRGAKLMPTFHPAFLLTNPEAKKDVWEDMKKVKAELGL